LHIQIKPLIRKEAQTYAKLFLKDSRPNKPKVPIQVNEHKEASKKRGKKMRKEKRGKVDHLVNESQSDK